MINLIDKIQNKFLDAGLNLFDIFILFLIGKIIKIRIDNTSAITPPSLFGIDRKMA